jgi:hypothetical protein
VNVAVTDVMASSSRPFKNVVGAKLRSSSHGDQSSSSSSASLQTSSTPSLRSNRVNSEGIYFELSEDDYDESENDDFVVDEDSSSTDDSDGDTKRMKTTLTSTTPKRKSSAARIANSPITNQETVSPSESVKKRKAVQKTKQSEKLEWKQTTKRLKGTLPAWKQPPRDYDYSDYSPREMWQLFFPKEWNLRVAKFMNTPHLLSGRLPVNTNVPELRAFIAIHIYMGIHNLPRVHMYWAGDHAISFLRLRTDVTRSF